MDSNKQGKSRVNQPDEARKIDGDAETLDAEIKSDQDQVVRRSHQKSQRFYESLTKFFTRKDFLHPRL